MNRRSALGALMITAVFTLGGCGALASRAGDDGSEAWVERVFNAREAARLQPGCMEGVEQSAYRNDRFVEVREPHGRRTVSVIAHVPQGLQVKDGDEVEIVPARCSKGRMPEVKQVFRE